MYLFVFNILTFILNPFLTYLPENKQFSEYKDDVKNIKIYVHTDKETYYPADYLYFKTYSFFLSGNKDTVNFRNLYVELYNPEKQLVFRRLLKSEKGFSEGYFFLSDTISGGDYWLFAHTGNYIQTADIKIFYKKIRIENENKIFYSISSLKNAQRTKRRKNYFEFSLYPEGQKIISGVENNISFSAFDKTGNSVTVTGKIYDDNKKICAEFSNENDKFGSFIFKPEQSRNYKIIVQNKSRKIKYEIKIQNKELKLEIQENDDKIAVLKKGTAKNQNSEFSLLVKSVNGEIIFPEIILRPEQDTIEFYKDKLSQGINEFHLVDANKHIISSVFFYKPVENFSNQIQFQELSQNVYKLNSESENIIGGNYSVSVTANSYETNSINIVDYIWYYSNLKNYFYKENSIGNNISLRAQIASNYEFVGTVSKENNTSCNFSGINISGKILTEKLNLPAIKIPVELTILNKYNDIYKVETDSLGRYSFDNLIYEDTIEYLIKIFPPGIARNYIIYPDSIINTINIQGKINNPDSVIFAMRKARSEINKQNSNGGYTDFTTSENRLHRYADRVIYFDDGAQDNCSALQAVANRVTGINENRESSLRGNGSFISDSEPMYLVDGIISDKNALRMISAADVERIEILTNPINTSIYGHNASNGIVAVYTKRGYHVIKNMYEGKTVAYHTSRKFVPENDIFNKANFNKKQVTLFWNPIFDFSSKEIIIDLNGFALGTNFVFTLQGLNYDSEPIYFSKVVTIK